MANIKPIDQSSDKWVRRASVAGPDYLNGVNNPKTSWSAASIAAEGNYKTGVIAAANRGAYGAGVRLSGDEKWRMKAAKIGAGRYPEGVSYGKDNWNKGFSPYHAVIGQVVLPPRWPKGSPQNIQRVAAIATALRQLKERVGK